MSQFPSPIPPPPLNIPASDHVVQLSIIDTTTRMVGLSSAFFLEPAIKGHEYLSTPTPAYSFLVESESGAKVLFDLGIPQKWEDTAPSMVNLLRNLGWGVSVTKNVSDILVEHGINLDCIDSVIWSHCHWDHTGDPSLFPPTTTLTVGPGFKTAMLPGYPTNPDSPILESAYKDRELIEISFDQSPELRIGQLRALDYFGDGSLYLLDAPGHAVGHICGLARTTPDTFVFLGGDICHHSGQMRPTEYLPLPESIYPNPFPEKVREIACPGSVLLELHPKHTAIEPFYSISHQGSSEDTLEAQKSLNNLADFDCYDNVFTIVAHDAELLDIVEFFPKTLNNWKARGYREKGLWKFVGNFREAVRE
ncbi:beta-lactamase-like protein [Rhizoctonia solani]|nr:beta-lactamase-like protein [Rhizoctonia solani]